MGLFDGLFEKKYCLICGKELGVFGKTKISEGHICKECSGKLSPYFHGYRSATADDIKAQLAYREENKAAVAAFNITRTLGADTKVYLDEDNGKVIITRTSPSNWASYNPDVFDFSQITGCESEMDETKTEIKRELPDGKKESYNPPRYDIDYDFYVTVFLSHPYASEIKFKTNPSRIEKFNSPEYRSAQTACNQIKDALRGIHSEQRAAATPKQPVSCPYCGATTTPDANGCCEYCGRQLSE